MTTQRAECLALIQRVTDYYGVTVDDILGKSHKAVHVRPRRIAIWLVWISTNNLQSFLANLFNRNESTISKSLKVLTYEFKTDKVLYAVAQKLRNAD